MTAVVNPLRSEIWFRIVLQPDVVGSLVFNCIHAETHQNWAPGDSGTWCWTEDGKLIGMGMACAHIYNQHFFDVKRCGRNRLANEWLVLGYSRSLLTSPLNGVVNIGGALD
jgi:hypothetical protein